MIPMITPDALDKLTNRTEEAVIDSGIHYYEFTKLLEAIRTIVPGRDDYPEEASDIEEWLEYEVLKCEEHVGEDGPVTIDQEDINEKWRRMTEIMTRIINTEEELRGQFWLAAVDAIREFDASIYDKYPGDVPDEAWAELKQIVDGASSSEEPLDFSTADIARLDERASRLRENI